MITRSVSAARRELGKLIEQARQGEDVVIIKDSRPVAALRRIDDDDLALTPELDGRTGQAALGMVRSATRKEIQFARGGCEVSQERVQENR